MPLDKKTITEVELGLVDPSFFATRLGYSKRVTLLFTDRKQEAGWDGCKKTALGCTSPRLINVNEAARNCDATCMIDVFAVGQDAIGRGGLTVGRPIPKQLTPRAFRSKMVLTIVHELVHVSQGWQIGDRFWRDSWEESVSAENRAEDYARVNPGMPNNAYLQDMFESGARSFTDRWLGAHRDEVNKGKFDFLLPMTVMRAMFPDFPNAFQ